MISANTVIVILASLTIVANLVTLYFIHRTKRALDEMQRDLEAATWEEVPVPDVAGWPDKPVLRNIQGPETR